MELQIHKSEDGQLANDTSVEVRHSRKTAVAGAASVFTPPGFAVVSFQSLLSDPIAVLLF